MVFCFLYIDKYYQYSLYIFLNQLINEQFRRQILPSIALEKDNEIDIIEEVYNTPDS